MSHARPKFDVTPTVARPCIRGDIGCLGTTADCHTVDIFGNAECSKCFWGRAKWDLPDPGGPHLAVSVAKRGRPLPFE